MKIARSSELPKDLNKVGLTDSINFNHLALATGLDPIQVLPELLPKLGLKPSKPCATYFLAAGKTRRIRINCILSARCLMPSNPQVTGSIPVRGTWLLRIPRGIRKNSNSMTS